MDSPIKPRPTGSRKRPHAQEIEAPGTFHLSPVQNGFFKSFDGTRLFCSTEGQGLPIVFCYGLVCSSLHWTYQIDHFKRQYKAVWFDYRGHQNSDSPKDMKSLTIPNIAKDLGVLLDELKIEKAVIMGHSMGVNVVLDFYRQQPERVAGMVLANGTPARPLETIFHGNVMQKGFELLHRAYSLSPKAVTYLWKRNLQMNPLAKTMLALGGFNPHLTPKEDVELYANQVSEMDPAILLNLINNYDNSDSTPWLHTVNVPTLILGGAQDHIVPLHKQELMHQLIPNSRFEVIHHGSHCPQMDLPELVNLKIENFLRDIGYVQAPSLRN